MKDTLQGRLALVTGAGRGNGAAIARGLAAAGARVIVTDVDLEAAHMIADSIVKAGGDARGHALDVTDEDSCTKLAQDISLLVGPISILVNNAGIFLRGGLTEPDSRARWERTMEVNVQGPFNVTMAFVEQLKHTKGSIVNIASINSFVAPAGSGVYPVSKGALAQFTRALASELFSAPGSYVLLLHLEAETAGLTALEGAEAEKVETAQPGLGWWRVPVDYRAAVD